MKVADIIERKEGNVVTVAGGTSLSDVTRELSRHNIGALLVLDENDGIAGIVSERDIVRHIAAEGKIEPTATVDDVMARDVRTCDPSDDVVDVMNWITRYRTRHLPVVDDGRLVGIVSIGDIVKHRLMEVETEQRVLRDMLIARRASSLLPDLRPHVGAPDKGHRLDRYTDLACRLALPVIRAVAKSFFLHLLDHVTHAAIAFALAMRKQVQVRNLGGRK